jgi:VanZ family protein
VVAWAALVFALSAQSSPLGPNVPFVDKVAHFLEFGTLSALLTRALVGSGVGTTRAVAAAIALSTLYGASDEIHQRFVPSRASDVFDLAADAVGACAGAWACGALLSRSVRGDKR